MDPGWLGLLLSGGPLKIDKMATNGFDMRSLNQKSLSNKMASDAFEPISFLEQQMAKDAFEPLTFGAKWPSYLAHFVLSF